MQSKGVIRLAAILLALACLWQLSFSLVSSIQSKKAADYAENAVEAFQQSAAFAKILPEDQAFVLDSVRKVENRWYIDSISSEKVYLGYTYKDVQAKEINLGLDLKGGMNVTLEVSVADILKTLSGDNEDPTFNKALANAKARQARSGENFLAIFRQEYEKLDPNAQLAAIFDQYLGDLKASCSCKMRL